LIWYKKKLPNVDGGKIQTGDQKAKGTKIQKTIKTRWWALTKQ